MTWAICAGHPTTDMPTSTEIYLDIETTWDRTITVIGISCAVGEVIQLVAPKISPRQVLDALPATGVMYTFNGHSFDLPVIKKQLGIGLRERYDSRDLRYLCKDQGLTGGQKAIEQHLGLKRHTEGVDGMEAIRLWDRWHRQGCEASLDRLLHYNREDVLGMRLLKETVTTPKLVNRKATT